VPFALMQEGRRAYFSRWVEEKVPCSLRESGKSALPGSAVGFVTEETRRPKDQDARCEFSTGNTTKEPLIIGGNSKPNRREADGVSLPMLTRSPIIE